jgi:hypothetical protein
MKIAVVTSLNKKLYDYYGHKFYETYNWDFDLFTYTEDDWIAPRGTTINLLSEVPECKKFVERNGSKDPSSVVKFDSKGRRMKPFKFDAVRFCYKVYAHTDLVMNRGDGYDGVIFVDADSVFHKSIDSSWVNWHLHRKDCMMTYLGRIGAYSECGFLYFNLNHSKTKEWSKRLYDVYSTDEIYTIDEWHDSFVVDHVRIEFEKKHGVKNYNIGFRDKSQFREQRKMKGHVQAWSILGDVYDHCKGARKDALKSPENKKI